MSAKGVEHLVIFTRSTWQPIPAATMAIALTRVVERKQVVLYPLRQMKTEPALSTQILTGLFVHQRNPLETTSSGLMSSKADIILPSSFPVFDLPPKLIFLDQGRKVHQPSFTAPTPCHSL